MKALLVVDIQNDFLPGGSLAVKEGDQVIPVANKMLSVFQHAFATQDFHPKDHESFASQHPGKSIGEMISLHGIPQVLWPDHCVQGTFGAGFAVQLDMSRIKRIFPKGTQREVDSYSAFFDNAKRRDTGLHTHLLKENIDTLYILGLATDYCVKYTALDAREMGYEVFVIEDGCRGVGLSSQDIPNSIEAMKKAGVKMISSKELL